MTLRTLGKTGLAISRMGLGMAALGRAGYINVGHAVDLPEGHEMAAMEEAAFGVLDAARAAGVRYFDVARSYGKGEAFLAAWLASRAIKPGELTIGSKWGYTYTADWKVEAEKHEIKDHSLANLRKQWEETRQTLGRYVNLYQIHSATIETGVLENVGVLDALVALQGEGIAIGLSLTGPRQAETLRRALKVRVNGEPVFDVVQATWNVLETSAGEALNEAHDAGMGVIVKEALANGRLTARNVEPAFAQQARVLRSEAERLGTTVDGLSLAAVLAERWVDVVLSGAATSEQLASNLEAEKVAIDAQASEILSTLAETPSDYWEGRSKLPWN